MLRHYSGILVQLIVSSFVKRAHFTRIIGVGLWVVGMGVEGDRLWVAPML